MRHPVVVVLLLAGVAAAGEPLVFQDDAALARFVGPERVTGPVTSVRGEGSVLSWVENAREREAKLHYWQVVPVGSYSALAVPGLTSARFARDGQVAVGTLENRVVVRIQRDGGAARVTSFARGTPDAISSRGRRAVVSSREGALTWALDGEAPRALATLRGGFVLGASFSPDESLVAIAYPDLAVHRVETGASIGSFVTTELGHATCAIFSSDGRFVFSAHEGRVASWALEPAPRVVATLDLAGAGIHGLLLSDDGRRLLVQGETGYLARVREDGTLAEPRPLPGARFAGVCDTHAVSYESTPAGVVVRRHPFDPVSVGGDTVSFEAAPAPVASADWPWLSARADWFGGVAGASSMTLALDLVNAKNARAYGVAGRLTFDPPLLPPQVVHVGVVESMNVMRRTVTLPRPASFDRGDVLVELRFEDPALLGPPPLRWHHLPRTVSSADELDGLAARIHSECSAVLRSVLGPEHPAPRLVRKHPEAVGFTTAYDGSRVEYQNPFTFSPRALDLNRQVMQATGPEEVLRDGEMMLFWFLPHEHVHAARSVRGLRSGSAWHEEYVANTVQPAITEQVVARLGAYPARTFRRVYDRYVERLRLRVTDADARAIEDFIASEGTRGPFERSPGEVFHEDVPLYVYFGARINQVALARGASLEELAERWLGRNR